MGNKKNIMRYIFTIVFLISFFSVQAELSITNLVDCVCEGSPQQAFNLVANGTAGPFTFIWSGPNGYTSEEQNPVNISIPGTYSVSVTNAYFCETVLTTTILSCGEPMELQEEIIPSCPGGMAGSITLTISGGEPPFTFEWINGETTQNISNLNPFAYSVTVTDVNGCSAEETFVVPAEGDIEVDFFTIASTCLEAENGRSSVFLQGYGIQELQYEWSNGETTQTIQNLPAGFYSVTITRPDGCPSFGITFVEPGDGFGVTPNIQKTNCLEGANGAISLFVNGYNTPYTFNWSSLDYPDFSSTSQNISALEAGTYCVTVTDSYGCTEENCWDITKDVVWPYITEVQVSLLGGANTPIYRGTWSEAAEGCLVYEKDENIFITDAALQAIANDAALRVEVITSTEMGEVAVDFLGVNVTAFQNPSGGTMWSYNAFGITSDMIDGNNTINQQLVFTGTDLLGNSLLSLGNNGLVDCVEVPELGENCTWNPVPITGEDLAHVLGEPCVEVNIIINDLQSSIEAQIVGEMPPYNGYSFVWLKDGTVLANQNSINYSESGEYCVRVTTPDNCTVQECISICNNLAEYDIVVANPTCQGDPPASVCFQPNNGFSLDDVQINWDFGDGTVFQNTSCIENLTAGTYNVDLTIVYFGCAGGTTTLPISFTVDTDVVSPLSIAGVSNPLMDCPFTPEGEGEICIEVSGGSEPYSYLWSDGSTNACLSGAYEGSSYGVMVTDACGITISQENLMTLPATALFYTILDIEDAMCSSASGTVSLLVGGGEGNFNVSWYNFTTGESGYLTSPTGNIELVDLSSGSYSVRIRTLCTQSTEVAFVIGNTDEPSVPFTIEETEITHICSENDLGEINISSISGDEENGPFTFTWSNGSSGNPISNLNAGIHTVTITNQNGCEIIENFEIIDGKFSGLSNFSVLNEGCPNVTDANNFDLKINYIFWSFSPIENDEYTFEWENPVSNTSGSFEFSNNTLAETFDNLAPSSFHVTITNTLGCTFIDEIDLSQNLEELITITLTDYWNEGINDDFQGQIDGGIKVYINGGNPPYTIRWYDAFSVNNNQVIVPTGNQIQGESLTAEGFGQLLNIAAGNYSLIVSDQNGCVQYFNYAIELSSCGGIDAPNANFATIPSYTDLTPVGTTSGGAINLDITGGTPPFQVQWTGPNGFLSSAVDLSNLIDAGEYCVVIHDANECRQEFCVELIDIEECSTMSLLLNHINNCRTEGEGISKLVFEGITIHSNNYTGLADFSLEWSHKEPEGGTSASGLVTLNNPPGGFNIFDIENVISGVVELNADQNTDDPTGNEAIIQLIATDENGCTVKGEAKFSKQKEDFIELRYMVELANTYPDHVWPTPLIDEFGFHSTCGCSFNGLNQECHTDVFHKHLIFAASNDPASNPNASNLCQLGGEIKAGHEGAYLAGFSVPIPPNNVGIYISNDDGTRCGCIFPPELVLSDYQAIFKKHASGNTFVETELEDFVYVELCDTDVNDPGIDFSITQNNNSQDDIPEQVTDQCEGDVYTNIVSTVACIVEYVCSETGEVIDPEVMHYKDQIECICINQDQNTLGEWRCRRYSICEVSPCEEVVLATYVDVEVCLEWEVELVNCNTVSNCHNCKAQALQNPNDDTSYLNTSSKSNTTFSTSVSPNPFTDEVNVSVYQIDEGETTFTLINSLGNTILNFSNQSFKGINDVNIEFNEKLENGIYFLFIEDDSGNQAVHKLIHFK